MTQKIYQKASVQTAFVSGILFLIGIAIPNIFNIPKLKDRIFNLEKENADKTAEVQRLETLLAPFRTIALERYTGTEADALSKLALRINELESSLNTIRDYSSVAQLDIFGLLVQSSNTIKFSSPLSKALEGCFTVKDGKVSVVYTPEAEKKFLDVIDRFSDFPFSYYGLAKYYKETGNPEWRSSSPLPEFRPGSRRPR